MAICATTLAWKCGSNATYTYVESTGTLTISGTGAMKDYDSSNRPWYNYRSSIKNVVINNGVTSIGDYAFEDCTGLTSVTIPDGVTRIGWHAFDGCSSLTSVTIPNSITSIGNYAFDGCKGLTSVTIPNSVTSIGDGAFTHCTRLTSVTIPNSVKSIGGKAFYGCCELTRITIPNSVTNIGCWAFWYCTGLTSITIPNSVTIIGAWAFSFCPRLTSINVAEDNLNYTSIDGVLYSKDKKTLIKCPEGKTGSVTIPNSVTSIESSAFGGCTGLRSMTVEATNPPFYFSSTNNIVSNYNIPLYVPAGSIDAYKAADEWKKFTNIQAIPATGVKEATAEKRESEENH